VIAGRERNRFDRNGGPAVFDSFRSITITRRAWSVLRRDSRLLTTPFAGVALMMLTALDGRSAQAKGAPPCERRTAGAFLCAMCRWHGRLVKRLAARTRRAVAAAAPEFS
jgi:hypothetical protein